jgi:hypothetical protein
LQRKGIASHGLAFFAIPTMYSLRDVQSRRPPTLAVFQFFEDAGKSFAFQLLLSSLISRNFHFLGENA